MVRNDPGVWFCPTLAALGLLWMAIQAISDRIRVKKEARVRSVQEREQSVRVQSQELDSRRQKYEAEMREARRALDLKSAALVEKQRVMREEIEQLAKERAAGFPWLANAYAEYLQLDDLRSAKALEFKSHPALKAAEAVREAAAKRRAAEKSSRIARYQLEYYESLFPWLTEFKEIEEEDFNLIKEENSEDGADNAEDPAFQFLAPGEYQNLSREEKFQRALDRYWNSRKTNWQIGREYERYVGFLFESQGYNVTFHGIIKGFDDLGRDLIARKGDETRIIQCKCWAQQKLIHEKHVFQLYGSVIEYWLSNMDVRQRATRPLFEEVLHDASVIPVIYTSTQLSERARAFAAALKVRIHEKVPLVRWPLVKCNCNNGNRIYHLPFDQQYDRTKISDSRTEAYVHTVKEAEDRHYRRAFRWRGQSS